MRPPRAAAFRPAVLSTLSCVSTGFLVVACAVGVSFAECHEYRDHFRWIGGLRMEDAGPVAVEGGIGCLAVPQVGVYTFRATDPTHPEWLGFVPISGWLSEVAIEKNHAYVVSQQWGLSIIDLTDPTNPVVIGTLDPPGFTWDVFLDLPLVYVASGSDGGGAHIIDASDPTQPVLVGAIPSPGNSYEIDVENGVAAIAGGNAGVRLHDVSDPENPVPLAYWDPGPRVYGVTWANGLLFAANDVAGLRILDASDPWTPVVIGSVDTPDQASSVTVWGGRALVGDRWSGMVQIDVSDPTRPVFVSRHGAAGAVYEVAVQEIGAAAIAFFGDNGAGLQIVDFTTRDALEPRAVTFAGMGVADLVVEDVIAYAAWPHGALHIYDIADPLAPLRLGQHLGSGVEPYRDLDVEETVVAAAAAGDGVDVFDATDPGSPVLAAILDPGAVTTGVALDGGRLLATTYDSVHLYDLADPYAPAVLATVALDGTAQSPVWNGTIAYVGLDSAVVVLDATDPRDLHEVSRLPMSARVRSIHVEGNEALVALNENGIAFLDLDTPLAPVLRQEVALPGYARRALPAGDHIHVATTLGFATLYRAADGEITVIGSATSENDVEAVAIVPGYVLVGDSSDGILTYDEPCPAPTAALETGSPAPLLLAAGPNPFRGRLRLDFSVPPSDGSLPAVVRVYSASGRCVRQLLDAPLSPGAHMLVWDGRDDRGRELPSGPYWIRVTAGAAGQREIETRAVRRLR